MSNRLDKRGFRFHLLIGAALFVGTYCGVFFGLRLRSDANDDSPKLRLRDPGASHSAASESGPGMLTGSRFPNERFRTKDGTYGHFRDLDDGSRTVLLFWSLSCESCVAQAEAWNAFIAPRLQSDVKVVACLEDDPTVLHSERARKVLSGMRVVFPDYDSLIVRYNLITTPTIILLDGDGIVNYVQEGASDFDRDLYRMLTEMVPSH